MLETKRVGLRFFFDSQCIAYICIMSLLAIGLIVYTQAAADKILAIGYITKNTVKFAVNTNPEKITIIQVSSEINIIRLREMTFISVYCQCME